MDRPRAHTESHARSALSRVAYHHFTVDVEEYFQVSAFERHVKRSLWPTLESRVVASTVRLLEQLESHGVRGTFFVLGLVAQEHPELVRRIASKGHEVASHGWGHRRVTTLRPEEFRLSVRRSREALQELSGQPVLGYRAPSFSITRDQEWAMELLVEEGYGYDSSLYPIRRPGYGHPDAPSKPAWLRTRAGPLLEVPPSVFRVAGARIPAGGGAYFRLLPYRLTRAALRQREREGGPGTFYLHPWELDPNQPRIPVPLLTRIRHYGGLERTGPRLERLLAEFTFRPIRETLIAMASE